MISIVDGYNIPHFGPFNLVIQREEIDGQEYTTFRPILEDGELLSPWCSSVPCKIEIISHE